MESTLLRYVELLFKLYKSNSKLPEKESEEFNRICRELMEELIRNPGGVIFIESPKKMEVYKFVIDRLFEIYSKEEIRDEILAGGYGGILHDEIDKYAERAKELIPTFISIKPSYKEFYIFYNEAMKCWFNGLRNSAVIISSTLLENMLRKKIRNPKLDFDEVINEAAVKGILSSTNKDKAHEIRRIRNRIAHKGFDVDSNTTLTLIRETKDILEEILN